jgi:hypothetical protein
MLGRENIVVYILVLIKSNLFLAEVASGKMWTAITGMSGFGAHTIVLL